MGIAARGGRWHQSAIGAWWRLSLERVAQAAMEDPRGIGAQSQQNANRSCVALIWINSEARTMWHEIGQGSSSTSAREYWNGPARKLPGK
jgi:hypothetical protein